MSLVLCELYVVYEFDQVDADGAVSILHSGQATVTAHVDMGRSPRHGFVVRRAAQTIVLMPGALGSGPLFWDRTDRALSEAGISFARLSHGIVMFSDPSEAAGVRAVDVRKA